MTAINISYQASAAPYASQQGAITAAINTAFNAWLSHFDAPLGAITVNVGIPSLGPGVAASSGPGANGYVPVGYAGNRTINMTGVAAEVATGAALPEAKRTGQLNLDVNWFRTYFADPAANAVEIQRVLQHEAGHMLGVIGYTYTGTAGPVRPTAAATAFDNDLTFVGTDEYFSGPNAIATRGGPVAMDYATTVHTYIAGGVSVMSYLDQAKTVQPLDVAILRDTGLPILSTQEVAEHQVTRLYLAALGRAPDAAGLLAQSQALLAGASLGSIAAGFLSSGEFAQRYGATQSNADFVNTLFQNVLGRTGDADGLRTWNNALAGGMSRADVLLGFSESTENRSKLEAAANQTYSETAEAQVERLYDAAFGRAPDAIGFGALVRGLLNGVTLQQEALGFLQSGEFTRLYGTPSDGAFVDALYQSALRRDADSSSRAQYLATLGSGISRADVLVGISESAEHVAKVIRQDTPAGAYLTDTTAHLGSIPAVPTALFG